MKRLYLLFSLLLFCAVSLNAKTYTILYLIPFDSERYEAPTVKECEDIENVRAYGLVGFWNGARIALEEYEAKNVPLKIIVRDVTNNESSLRRVLEDRQLMSQVDLIVGPFFSSLFEIAARYAADYQIPIVNPFTSRHNIVEDNEFVFKLKPSPDARPAMIAFLAQQQKAFPVLVYGNSDSNNKEWLETKKYFEKNSIPYEMIPSASSIYGSLKDGKKQILLSFDNNTAGSLMISRNLIFSKKIENLTFIVPESWLESKTYDIEYYSQLNLHFFSDYYVNFNDDATKVFIYNYTQKFSAPPTLKNFAFQGYDITRFFVEYLLNDKDVDRVKIEPLAFPLSFDKIPDGGYENVNLQFLEIIDNEIVPSGF